MWLALSGQLAQAGVELIDTAQHVGGTALYYLGCHNLLSDIVSAANTIFLEITLVGRFEIWTSVDSPEIDLLIMCPKEKKRLLGPLSTSGLEFESTFGNNNIIYAAMRQNECSKVSVRASDLRETAYFMPSRMSLCQYIQENNFTCKISTALNTKSSAFYYKTQRCANFLHIYLPFYKWQTDAETVVFLCINQL